MMTKRSSNAMTTPITDAIDTGSAAGRETLIVRDREGWGKNFDNQWNEWKFVIHMDYRECVA